MTDPRPSPRLRIWVLMAVVAASALGLWGYSVLWPRVRAWWPNRHILAALDRPATLTLPPSPTLGDLLKALRTASASPALPSGIPVYIDPSGLTKAGRTIASPIIAPPPPGGPLGASLQGTLGPLGLAYTVENGLLTITQARR